MRKLILLLLTLSFINTLQAAGIETLKWLETANPQTDAINAVNNNDLRLRAVYGFTLSIPGTEPSKVMKYKASYGINPIIGTSDTIENKEHGRLIKLANEYAKQYNGIILKHGKKKL